MRNALSFLLRFGIVIAGLTYAFWGVDVSRALDLLAGFRLLPLAGALFFGLLIQFFMGLRFQAIAGGRATLTQATLACVFSSGLNILLPARLGEFGKCFYLREHAAIPVRESLGLIFWERFADLNMVLLLAGAVSLAAQQPLGWLPLVVLVTGLWCAVAVLILLPRARTLLIRLIPMPGWRRVAGDMLEHFAGISTPAMLWKLAWLSLATWACMAVTFTFNTCVVGGVILPWADVLTVFAISALGLLIPSSPGSLGVFEAALVFGFGRYGVGREAALALALLARLTQNAPVVLISLVLLGRGGLGLRGFREALARVRTEVTD